MEVTVSSRCLTESNSGFCDRRAQCDEAPAPDPAQQVGFGIVCIRPVAADFAVKRSWQDQPLLGARKSRERTAQSSSNAVDFARENCCARLVGLLNECEDLVDPTGARHRAGPKKHQPIAARRRGSRLQPRAKWLVR